MNPPRSSSSTGNTCRYAACHVRSWTAAMPSASPPVAGLTLIERTVKCGAMKFEHVLVVGAGQMGGGIAQVVAASGRRVSLHDPYPGAVDKGLAAMERSLGKLGADVEGTLARVNAVDELVPADLMIEAITEDAGAKEELFR